ncbi:MAG: tRNA epoxyqueuosine(34) reductase QueG [Polyangiaceae bacterium]|nr:tRNA epoxyqueuosine(34) reductase QueG [Polyangiaceae bacterium]
MSDEPPRPARPARAPAHAVVAELERLAASLGLVRLGVTTADPLPDAQARLARMIADGRHGSLDWLASDARTDPRLLLEGARSVLVAALPCGPGASPGAGDQLAGEVASYAQGADYRPALKAKLEALVARLGEVVGRPVRARLCVDTAPLMERALAVRSGIAFAGKSTFAIVPGVGTWVLLGAAVVDVALPAGIPLEDGCGGCRACLDACPTSAFVDAHVLDARRCISYLTIETDVPVPEPLREGIGLRAFGCDECQRVCPYNHGAAPRSRAPELAPRPALAPLDLLATVELGAAGYRKLVKRTSLRRASRAALARNAAIALGNTGDRRGVPALARALALDPKPLVRRHAAWALGRLGGPDAVLALEAALRDDADPAVRHEAKRALAAASSAAVG